MILNRSKVYFFSPERVKRKGLKWLSTYKIMIDNHYPVVLLCPKIISKKDHWVYAKGGNMLLLKKTSVLHREGESAT